MRRGNNLVKTTKRPHAFESTAPDFAQGKRIKPDLDTHVKGPWNESFLKQRQQKTSNRDVDT
jgi:hypothetical protein